MRDLFSLLMPVTLTTALVEAEQLTALLNSSRISAFGPEADFVSVLKVR